MNRKQMIEKRGALVSEIDALLKHDELTEEQRTRYDAAIAEIEQVDKQIKQLDAQEARKAAQEDMERRQREAVRPVDFGTQGRNSRREQNDIDTNFSLGRLVCQMSTRGAVPTGIEAELVQEGQMEARESGIQINGDSVMVSARAFERRDLSVTGGTGGNQGGDLVQNNKINIIDALFPRSVFGELGATILTGLVGNVEIPRLVKGTLPSGKAENATASEYSPTTDSVTLQPKRLPTHVDVSKQLMVQSQFRNVEMILEQHIRRVLGTQMQAAYVNGSGTNAARGILQTSGIGAVFAGGAASDATNADGAAPVWADIVNLLKEVDIDDALFGSLAYLMSPQLRAKLQRTAIILEGSGTSDKSQAILPGNATLLNGYNYRSVTSVPATLSKGSSGAVLSALIFGDFSSYYIAQWSGIELMVDPYSLATTGQSRVHAAVYYDGAVIRPQSFAAGDDFSVA